MCDHMTSFAILMSMEPIPDYLEEIQSAITNPLIGFSLFCLLFMVVTVMPFKALRFISDFIKFVILYLRA